ncbi:MAG: QueT transporter family protein [Nitrososphaeria archaeon]|jgi:uncharacterized membrane protein
MKKGKTRMIALTAIFAASYYAITLAIAPIAFLSIQCRISDAMYALIPLFGFPMIAGITIGNFIGNLSSPVGMLDWITPFVLILPQIAIWKLGNKAQPILIASISLWVAFILNRIFAVPLLLTIITVAIGEIIAIIGIGFPLFFALKKRLKLWI